MLYINSINYQNGEQKADYHRFSEENIELFVYYRSEFGTRPNYFELSEEFRLWYNLFEEYLDLNDRNCIFIDSIDENEDIAHLIYS